MARSCSVQRAASEPPRRDVQRIAGDAPGGQPLYADHRHAPLASDEARYAQRLSVIRKAGRSPDWQGSRHGLKVFALAPTSPQPEAPLPAPAFRKTEDCGAGYGDSKSPLIAFVGVAEPAAKPSSTAG